MALKLQFKVQEYQTEAVQAVVDCFNGQPRIEGVAYRIDPGKKNASTFNVMEEDALAGLKNADLVLNHDLILKNIQSVQRNQNLLVSKRLGIPVAEETASATPGNRSKRPKKPNVVSQFLVAGCPVNLDIEMETGTGKTYCYIKTMFELHRQYGWSRFIIVVPSIAIREGVHKSIQITAEHFQREYKQQIKSFVYDSSKMHEIESFSSDGGINLMIINIQAFNSTGKEQRRINDVRDDFQSRKPIDVIAANRPILILDEPQKMEGASTLSTLANFKPLMILRYSATHKTQHNKIFRLDAVDAYNQRLVKKIAVCGITVRGIGGLKAYLYLKAIDVSPNAPPVARLELDVKLKGGEIKRKTLLCSNGDELFAKTKLEAYKNLMITNIDAALGKVEIGKYVLHVGEVNGDVDTMILRRIQIRETIKAHLEKERELFSKGIKVLSLFFIDHVKLYRDYEKEDAKGEYARIFEEEYESIKKEFLDELPFDEYKSFHEYLKKIDAEKTHAGYFSIDKNSSKLVDPSIEGRGENKGESNDTNAYDLILKDKERLLSLTETPVRFLFSHSALGVGWDNPNVFVMCMLKQTDNEDRRRQEVGRGLRLAVNQEGIRMDHPRDLVHEINRLTVVTNESYKSFVEGLQKEIRDNLSSRPKMADQNYFQGKSVHTLDGTMKSITLEMANQIVDYLVINKYVDAKRHILEKYYLDKENGTVAELPAELQPYSESLFKLIDGVFAESQLPPPDDANKEKENKRSEKNFAKKEFQEIWNRINRKVIYKVDFDSSELIRNSVTAINEELHVTPLQYLFHRGEQMDTMDAEILARNKHFTQDNSEDVEIPRKMRFHSEISYDLLGKIVDATYLKRATVASILSEIKPEQFEQFPKNPEHFISEVSRIVNEQKACMIVEKLTYDETSEEPDANIFATPRKLTEKSRIGKKLKKHVYEYAETDSEVEQQFSESLDNSDSVVVYAKLPKGFSIPTPLGDEGYHPDWAIAFKEEGIKHIYFVAETKGSMSSLQIRPIEKKKIDCAKKFFDKINEKFKSDNVKYDVVDGFDKLMDIVKK